MRIFDHHTLRFITGLKLLICGEPFILCSMGSLPISSTGRKQNDWETENIEGMYTWLLCQPDVCTAALNYIRDLMTF